MKFRRGTWMGLAQDAAMVVAVFMLYMTLSALTGAPGGPLAALLPGG